MLAKTVQKKEPITCQMLTELVADTNRHSSLANLRLAAACLMAYAVFHFDELVHLCLCDVQIDPTMLKLHICQSKTNQLHKGDINFITEKSTL